MSKSKYIGMMVGMMLGSLMAVHPSAAEASGSSSISKVDSAATQVAGKPSALEKASSGTVGGKATSADSVRAEKARVREAGFMGRKVKTEKRLSEISDRMLKDAKTRREARIANSSEGGRPTVKKEVDPAKKAGK